MERITVALGDRSYPVYVGSGIIGKIGSLVEERRASILTDEHVATLFGERVQKAIDTSGTQTHMIVVPPGEQSKQFSTLEHVYDELLSFRSDRKTPLVALGGGVIGDLGGFAAGTFLRGIPYIQVPTTLLAQVDSSVGGKTAVNHPLGKNLIGVFYQPRFVLADVETLSSLPEEEYLSGLAEVIKHAVIADEELFSYLETHHNRVMSRDRDALMKMVTTSVRIKSHVVSQDEREADLRRILNFGHTFGHAIERLSGFGTIRHGHAVATGMAAAVRISEKLGEIDSNDVARIITLLEAYRFQTELPGYSNNDFVNAINYDKKAQEAHINFVLTAGIGYVTVKKMRATDIVDIIGQLGASRG
ncbi:MAG: 3-dehydroquinate synthase [Deltaproteobacteria bacterium]|nr:3-dehydroquinate synthase [Candidatus Zymogenaceae bacterium]